MYVFTEYTWKNYIMIIKYTTFICIIIFPIILHKGSMTLSCDVIPVLVVLVFVEFWQIRLSRKYCI